MLDVTETTTLEFGLPGKVTRLALALPHDLDFDEWRRAGELIGNIRAGTAWWAGDWLNFGEAVYGEKYAQAMDSTGLSYHTLVNLAHIARKVAPETRRDLPLTWAHHAEVARFDDAATQTWWLDKAVAEGWTSKALRAAIREEIQQVGGKAEAAAAQTVGEQVEEAVRKALHEWLALEVIGDLTLDGWLPGRVREIFENAC